MMTDVQLIDTLRCSNVRPSVHRLAVLGYIANFSTHPTADEVFNAVSVDFPTVSRTTVYNSLHTLVQAGVIRELEIDSASMRYDLAHQLPHSHFRCTRCGKIFDMSLPDGLENLVKPGFVVQVTDLYFAGICPDCTVLSGQNK